MRTLNKTFWIAGAGFALAVGFGSYVVKHTSPLSVGEQQGGSPNTSVAPEKMEVATIENSFQQALEGATVPARIEPIDSRVFDFSESDSIADLADLYESDRKSVSVTLPINGGVRADLTERKAFSSTSRIYIGKEDVTDSIQLSRLFVGQAVSDPGSIVSVTVTPKGTATGFATIEGKNYTFELNATGFAETQHVERDFDMSRSSLSPDVIDPAEVPKANEPEQLKLSFAPDRIKRLRSEHDFLFSSQSQKHVHTEACYVEIPNKEVTGTALSLITDPGAGPDIGVVKTPEIASTILAELPAAAISNAIQVSNKSAVEIYAGGNWYIDVPAGQSILSILTYTGGSAYYPVTYYPNYTESNNDTSGSQSFCGNPQSSGAESKVNGLENCVITDPGAGRYVIRPAQVSPTDSSVNMQMSVGYIDELASDQLIQVSVTVVIEKDFIDQMGGNDQTNDYLQNLVGYVTDTWEAQIQAKPVLGDVLLLTENLPDGAGLSSLDSYYTENYPDLGKAASVYLLTTSSRKSGGVAYLDGICRSDYGYAVSGHNGTVPANWDNNSYGYSWDPMVWSHELGHNMNSPHTHEFEDIGNDDRAVDHCYDDDSSGRAQTLPGPKDSDNPLVGGIAGQGTGTIMSYCHLMSGGVNTSFTFGKGHGYGVKPDRVTDNMRSRLLQKAAGSPCLPIVTGQQTAPPAPTIDSDSKEYSDTVSFSITADGNSAVTQFKVTCTAGESQISGTSARSPVAVTGLASATNYSCVATVTNAIGESPASATYDVTTLDAPTVPSAPSITEIDRLNRALEIEFNAGSENRSRVEQYTATCGSQSNVGTESPITVSGLAVGVEYGCSVVARNGIGNSPASAVVNQTTMPLPPAPTVTLIQPAINSVNVVFDTVTDGASESLDYIASCDGITETAQGSPIQITGLQASTSYTCTVRAQNEAGDSPDSNGLTVTTKAADFQNTAPVVQDISITTSPDTDISQAFSGSDADGDSLVYSIVDQPTNGRVSLNDSANGFVYDPNWSSSSDIVDDSFTYRANDGLDDSGLATVSIRIENRVPVANDLAVDTYKNTAVSGTVSATDTENDSFSLSIVDQPTKGSVTLRSYSGEFTYTPNEDATGTDSFTFKATEGYGQSARDSQVATVTITIDQNELSYDLNAGWNLIGFLPSGTGTWGLPDALRSTENVDLIWKFDYSRNDWDGYSPDYQLNSQFGNGETIESYAAHDGLWVKAKKGFSVTLDEVPAASTALSQAQTYESGWNLVSPPAGAAVNVTDLAHHSAVWLYRNGNWLFYSDDSSRASSATSDGFGTFTTIQPDEAVWTYNPN